MTIEDAIQEGARRLARSGVPEGRRAAGLLLCRALGIDRAQLLVRSKDQLGDPSYQTYIAFVERRAAGEPLQYITGHQEFYGLDFAVTPDVLIPRPETESLVERVIALAGQARYAGGPLIVDVGTGSGCVAVALAVEIKAARVIAIDVSPRALKVARANAARHGVSARLEFIEGDLLGPLEGRLEAEVDFIASNPPYVPSKSFDSLQPEVRDWEPAEALLGGEEGVDFYRRLFGGGQTYLKRGGHLVCEMGFGQLDQIKGMIDSERWALVDVTCDLQNIPRTLALRKL